MKAAIYLRVSTDDQSTEMQRDDLVKYCELHRLDYEIFEEKASGKSRDRAELTRMMAMIKSGAFDRLVIWRLDRLGRSVRDLTNIIFELEANNCQLISFKESIDMSSPAGRLMANMIGCFAQFEREVLIDRTNAGIASAKRNGVKFGPPETPLDIDRLRSMKASGASIAQLSRESGLSRSQLYRRLAG